LIVVEALLVLFLSTAYGSISRAYAFNNRYDTTRTVVSVSTDDQISLHSMCFCQGKLQAFSSCYNGQKEVFFLETSLLFPVEVYYKFLQDLTLNVPRSVACVVSRPGHGWSDAIPLSSLHSESLPSNNVRYLAAWMQQNGLSTPVYLIGHQYGGLHIAQFLIRFPSLVKSLIFVDTYDFARILHTSAPTSIPSQVIQLYGLEGLLAFWCDIGQLPQVLRGTDVTSLDAELQYSMASKFIHTQMLETLTRDESVNLLPAMNEVVSLCGKTLNASRHVPTLWITSKLDTKNEEVYACLTTLINPPIRRGLNSSVVMLFVEERARLIEILMAFIQA
jgi:pimeloyl-ACP methyl ester carboxylesterase